MPPLLSISAKIWNFLLWNIVSLQPRVVWRWFFILVNSDVPFFWKIKILKKGGQRGGRYLNMKFNDNYDKKYKYDAQNRSQSLVLCYIWSESMFWNNATPKNARPFPPPLIFIHLGYKFYIFPLFWGWTQYSWNSRNRCPPFLPPLFSYLKSSRFFLQFFILSSYFKMHCFGCTDPLS